jgi:hypothetical protein
VNKADLFRLWLPYGLWTCADGREVLFNRAYRPIWERVNGVTKRGDEKERVKWVKQKWFFDDGTSPWYNPHMLLPLLQTLKDFGATWEPIAHYVEVQRAVEKLK